jgi:hypothetical protein
LDDELSCKEERSYSTNSNIFDATRAMNHDLIQQKNVLLKLVNVFTIFGLTCDNEPPLFTAEV